MARVDIGRRQFPRISSEHPVHVRKLAPQDFESSAKTASLSLGGCMFVSREAMGPDAMVDLLISVRPRRVIEARGRVVYERSWAADRFEVGVEFTAISDEDRSALATLLTAPAAPMPPAD